MAPEQGRGQPVDHRSDLYSMGVLLFRMLSGQLPFDADSPTAKIFQHVYEPPPPLESVAPEVPRGLSAVVSKLLAKSPAQRYDSAGQVLADLQAVRQGASLPSRADEALAVDGGVFARPVRESDGRGGTVIIEAPRFGSEPSLPEVPVRDAVPPRAGGPVCSAAGGSGSGPTLPKRCSGCRTPSTRWTARWWSTNAASGNWRCSCSRGTRPCTNSVLRNHSGGRPPARRPASCMPPRASRHRISARSAQAHAEQVAEELGHAVAQQREQLDTMQAPAATTARPHSSNLPHNVTSSKHASTSRTSGSADGSSRGGMDAAPPPAVSPSSGA